VEPGGKPSPIHRSDSEITQTAIRMLVTEKLWDGLDAKGYTRDQVGQIHISGRSTGCR